MKLESLRRLPRSGSVVLTADGREWKLPQQTADEYGLAPGLELDEDVFRQILKEGQMLSAKNRAVRILAASGVTEQELENRLVQKGEQPDCAREAVDWLRELHLLDDLETAKQLVRGAAARGYGRSRIKSILYEKRVPREYWDEALAEMPPMEDAVDAFLAKRFAGKQPDEKEIHRAIDALQRRGFSWSEIQAGLRRFDAEPEQMEDME